MVLTQLLLTMVLKVGCYFLLCVLSFTFNVFDCIAKFIHRLKTDYENYEEKNENLGAMLFPRNDLVDHNFHGFEETEEDTNQETFESEGSDFMQDKLVSSESKYQFLFSKNYSGFVMDQQVISFTVEEMFVDFKDDVLVSNNQILDEGSNNFPDSDDHLFNVSASVDQSFQEHNAEIDFTEKSVDSLKEKVTEIVPEKADEAYYEKTAEVGVSTEFDEPQQKQVSEIDGSEEADESLQLIIAEIDDSRTGDSDEDVEDVDVEENVDAIEEKISPAYGSLENQEDNDTFEISLQQVQRFDEDQASIFYSKLDLESSLIDDENPSAHPEVIFTEEDDPEAEYIEINPYVQLPADIDNIEDTFSLGKSEEESFEADGAQADEFELLDDLQNLEGEKSEKILLNSDSGDEDEIDILQEHQHLVQQMKMEMRYSKVKGLPTISEDCESPKSVEYMKPLRIDQKFEYKDCMAEIQKFYRSYADKMRKLDILNYQKLHAISFLQLKDSEVFLSGHKSPVSHTKLFILKSWPCKMQRIHTDSTHKLLSETYQDLELVYIGQICHSWEILNWQYTKAKELLQNEPQGYHSFIKVASEFQQFQVLIERFVEDEPFQGNSRIQHYVKNRCLLRSLLHVPMIKDDCYQDRKDKERVEQNVILVTELAKIIKQSMQVFWEFLSCEKGEPKMINKAAQESEADNRDPEDAKLLMHTKLTLQQKERRFRDIMRSRSCIVKKFQKSKKGGQDHALFISQVELKLVSRVLNLSRITTDQLLWCKRKLDNISLIGRKVHVEPSFWLFPC